MPSSSSVCVGRTVLSGKIADISVDVHGRSAAAATSRGLLLFQLASVRDSDDYEEELSELLAQQDTSESATVSAAASASSLSSSSAAAAVASASSMASTARQIPPAVESVASRVAAPLPAGASVVHWCPHPDKSTFVAAVSTQRLLVWDTQSLARQSRHTGQNHAPHRVFSHERNITGLDWSPHCPHTLVTSSLDSYVHVWDLRTGTSKPAFSQFAWTSSDTHVAWNRVNVNMIACANEGDYRLWDIRFNRSFMVMPSAHSAKITGIDWSHESADVLLTCGQDKHVRVWEPSRRKCTYDLQLAHPGWRSRFAPNGPALVTAAAQYSHGESVDDDDTTLHLWPLAGAKATQQSGPLQPTLDFPIGRRGIREFVWRPMSPASTRVSPSHRDFQLMTLSRDHVIQLWHIPANVRDSFRAAESSLVSGSTTATSSSSTISHGGRPISIVADGVHPEESLVTDNTSLSSIPAPYLCPDPEPTITVAAATAGAAASSPSHHDSIHSGAARTSSEARVIPSSRPRDPSIGADSSAPQQFVFSPTTSAHFHSFGAAGAKSVATPLGSTVATSPPPLVHSLSSDSLPMLAPSSLPSSASTLTVNTFGTTSTTATDPTSTVSLYSSERSVSLFKSASISSTDRFGSSSTTSRSSQRASKTLTHEFALINFNQFNLTVDVMDAAKQTLVVTAGSGPQYLRLRFTFPNTYPVRAPPTFSFLPETTVFLSVRERIIKVLNDAAWQQAKHGRTCLDHCLR